MKDQVLKYVDVVLTKVFSFKSTLYIKCTLLPNNVHAVEFVSNAIITSDYISNYDKVSENKSDPPPPGKECTSRLSPCD